MQEEVEQRVFTLIWKVGQRSVCSRCGILVRGSPCRMDSGERHLESGALWQLLPFAGSPDRGAFVGAIWCSDLDNAHFVFGYGLALLARLRGAAAHGHDLPAGSARSESITLSPIPKLPR